MAQVRFATWNVEWFNALFDDRGVPWRDDAPSARHGITRKAQTQAVATVLAALDADAVMVIEAPDTGSRRSTVRALARFARDAGIRARQAVHGFVSETEQEIALLYDPQRVTARHDPQGDPRFDAVWLNDAATPPERVRFSKPPLELALTVAGRDLRMIGVHAKSKAPHGAKSETDAIRIAVENRRKQLAECTWLRHRAEMHLARGDSLIVLGDFNDGPGIDLYEAQFGRSGIEIVLGAGSAPDLRLTDPHARLALRQRLGVTPTTARFWLAPEQRYFEALLDFILVSPDLAARAPAWRIWHPLNDPGCLKDAALAAALLAASDHFPVTLDIGL